METKTEKPQGGYGNTKGVERSEAQQEVNKTKQRAKEGDSRIKLRVGRGTEIQSYGEGGVFKH